MLWGRGRSVYPCEGDRLDWAKSSWGLLKRHPFLPFKGSLALLILTRSSRVVLLAHVKCSDTPWARRVVPLSMRADGLQKYPTCQSTVDVAYVFQYHIQYYTNSALVTPCNNMLSALFDWWSKVMSQTHSEHKLPRTTTPMETLS